jgi:fatty acid desaturase
MPEDAIASARRWTKPVSAPPSGATVPWDDAERIRKLADDLDALYARTLARMGEDDVRYIRRMRVFSRVMEAVGRLFIHVSIDPMTFAVGVLALGIHKQVELIEIGHTVLHGAYDNLAGAKAYHAKTFRWNVPIDEESWRESHNFRHHGATNIVDGDPDLRILGLRFSKHVPWTSGQRVQVAALFGVLAPFFASVVNGHVTGLNDRLTGIPACTRRVRPERWSFVRRASRKSVPVYLKELLLFPALAGPMFAKVALGNLLAQLASNVYTGFTVVAGHTGEHVASWPAGTRPSGRAEWYALQLQATQNFEVCWALSILCGGIDKHIEHHLFPKLPPHRLREIAPAVRALCELHGVPYRTDSWGSHVRAAVRQLSRLAERPESAAPAMP